eukprot:sb/3470445/
MEKQAVSMWGQECANNMYSCIASPDAETGKVLEFFKVLLPKLKNVEQDQTSAAVTPNCSTLVKQGTSLMGCCMGTLVEIEKKLNVTHPNSPDMMAPGDALLKLCGATAEPACKSSKDQLKDQETQYEHCKSALRANAKSECIELEDSAHVYITPLTVVTLLSYYTPGLARLDWFRSWTRTYLLPTFTRYRTLQERVEMWELCGRR